MRFKNIFRQAGDLGWSNPMMVPRIGELKSETTQEQPAARDEAPMADFGTRLKELRLQYGYTQSDLAKKSKLGQSTISALETGRQSPWPSTRRALAKAFHMTLAELDAATRPSRGPARGEPSWGGGGEYGSTGPPTLLATSAAPPYPGERTTPPTPSDEHPFAGSKIMDLLNQLGEVEHELSEYRSFEQHFPGVAWTTDTKLHLTACFGPTAAGARKRFGDFVGRHLREFLEEALGATEEDGLPLATHQMALDGLPVRRVWESEDNSYLLLAKPVRNVSGAIVGAVTLAVDITNTTEQA
jgi:transcriptional regulator with XRE-family HTH domain